MTNNKALQVDRFYMLEFIEIGSVLQFHFTCYPPLLTDLTNGISHSGISQATKNERLYVIDFVSPPQAYAQSHVKFPLSLLVSENWIGNLLFLHYKLGEELYACACTGQAFSVNIFTNDGTGSFY